MLRRPWFVQVLSLLFVLACTVSLRAENEGQEDLDKATQLKVVAEKLDDLAEVIDHLDEALEKGLDKENEEIANQMLVSTLMQRGSMFAAAVFNVPETDPQRTMRQMQLRSWALTDLQRAATLDESLLEAQMMIGKLQALQFGDNNAARLAFTAVIKNKEATPEQKAEAYALRSAVQKNEERRLEDISKAVELAPKQVEYLRVRSQYLYGKEKFDEALKDIDEAIKLDDNHAATHELRGMILLGLDKPDEALKSFDKASELEPDAALPYQHRAELYRQSGNLEKAVEQLTKALELSPNNVAALLIRSAVLYELKETDKAMADVEQAIRVAPRLAQPYLMRAEILAASNRLDEAINQLEQINQQAPGNVPILSRLGSFYLMSERPNKAIGTLTEVIEQEPDNFNALRFRGDAYLNTGKHAEAVADFDKALDLQGEDESLLNNFAWVLATSPDEEVRNGKRAIELATKASELTGHQTPHVLSTLGAAYAETGDFETAKKWSQQAIDIAKKAAEAAKNDEEREKLENDAAQLQKEYDSYLKKEPVRERQTKEDAPVKEEKEDDKAKESDGKPETPDEPESI